MMYETGRAGSAVTSILILVLCACSSTRIPVAGPEPFESDVEIRAGNERLPGSIYVAEGEGPHPTLVWFHGFPGLPSPTDETIDALRNEGINVLYVHYRGAWGAPGGFSAWHALEDAAAMMAFARSPEAAAAYRIDPARVIPVGDSFGSWIALATAAVDPRAPCAAGSLVLNLGRLGSDLSSDEAMREGFLQMFTQIDDDPQLSYRLDSGAGELIREIITERRRYDLALTAPALADRPVLLIGAADDELAPVAIHLDPVADAYRSVGAGVTRHILPGGHELLDAEYAGIVAEWVKRECR